MESVTRKGRTGMVLSAARRKRPIVSTTPASLRMAAGGNAMAATDSGAIRVMSRSHSSKALGPPYLAV